jgi:carnitine-CoA ligase
VVIADEAGTALGIGQRGEIWVRERVRGVLMKDYFHNPEATVAALKDGWLRTGDVGWFDADGNYYFVGRKKDSIRRRGENITAFEIERIADEHPEVAESSAIGVANELADEDITDLPAAKAGSHARSPRLRLLVRGADGSFPDSPLYRIYRRVSQDPDRAH